MSSPTNGSGLAVGEDVEGDDLAGCSLSVGEDRDDTEDDEQPLAPVRRLAALARRWSSYGRDRSSVGGWTRRRPPLGESTWHGRASVAVLLLPGMSCTGSHEDGPEVEVCRWGCRSSRRCRTFRHRAARGRARPGAGSRGIRRDGDLRAHARPSWRPRPPGRRPHRHPRRAAGRRARPRRASSSTRCCSISSRSTPRTSAISS